MCAGARALARVGRSIVIKAVKLCLTTVINIRGGFIEKLVEDMIYRRVEGLGGGGKTRARSVSAS